jgi:hypothetical protein
VHCVTDSELFERNTSRGEQPIANAECSVFPKEVRSDGVSGVFNDNEVALGLTRRNESLNRIEQRVSVGNELGQRAIMAALIANEYWIVFRHFAVLDAINTESIDTGLMQTAE